MSADEQLTFVQQRISSKLEIGDLIEPHLE
jgi:hypothetical protein